MSSLDSQVATDEPLGPERFAARRRGVVDLARRSGRAVKEAFAPSGMAGVPYLRVTRALYRVRVLVGVIGLGVFWVFPHESRNELYTYITLVGGFFVYSVVLLIASRRSEHPAVRLVGLVGDMTTLFLFHTLLEQTRFVALFGYMLILAFYASLGGLLAGLIVGGAIMGIVTYAETTVYVGRGLDAYTLMKYGLVVVAMANLLDTVTKEQRRANRRLAALHDSLRYVSSSLELDEVLDALTRSVRESLGAVFARVMLSEGDDSEDQAKTDGRLAVVEDLQQPGAPPDLARLGRDLGFRSIISVPLTADERCIGVLNAGFRQKDQITDEERDLVSAYAEQATAAVLRARSYDQLKRAREQIKQLNAGLERRVAQRTAELERIRSELHSQLEVTSRQAAALGEISKRISGARDEERRRLARDLHDGVQQQLVVLRMNLALNHRGGYNAGMFADIEGELDRIIERMREVAQNIYPSILLDRGLTAAVHSYAGRLPLSTRVVSEPDPLPRLDPEVESTAYFVLCEAVTNALKHSRGTQLSITLRVADTLLELVVRDDGEGFRPGTTSKGRGLLHMCDRVGTFGGELTITCSDHEGVEVRAAIPLEGCGEQAPATSPKVSPGFAEERTEQPSPAG